MKRSISQFEKIDIKQEKKESVLAEKKGVKKVHYCDLTGVPLN